MTVMIAIQTGYGSGDLPASWKMKRLRTTPYQVFLCCSIDLFPWHDVMALDRTIRATHETWVETRDVHLLPLLNVLEAMEDSYSKPQNYSNLTNSRKCEVMVIMKEQFLKEVHDPGKAEEYVGAFDAGDAGSEEGRFLITGFNAMMRSTTKSDIFNLHFLISIHCYVPIISNIIDTITLIICRNIMKGKVFPSD